MLLQATREKRITALSKDIQPVVEMQRENDRKHLERSISTCRCPVWEETLCIRFEVRPCTCRGSVRYIWARTDTFAPSLHRYRETTARKHLCWDCLCRQGSEDGRSIGKVPRGWVEYRHIEKITQQQEAEFDDVLPSRFGNPIDDGNVTFSITEAAMGMRGNNITGAIT